MLKISLNLTFYYGKWRFSFHCAQRNVSQNRVLDLLDLLEMLEDFASTNNATKVNCLITRTLRNRKIAKPTLFTGSTSTSGKTRQTLAS